MKRFFQYVEIKTKITSTFAFVMSIAFLIYLEESIKWKSTLVFFGAMFIFDLTTTAINNYIDSKTNGQILPFSRKTAFIIIMVMLGISTLLGLYLVYLTDILIFFVGGLCFICGILYTFGPVPISRQPLGEVISGVFYGFFIPFLICYICLPSSSFVTLLLSWERIFIEIKPDMMLKLILLSIIPFCTTANIMLANNICDLEKDVEVKRYTLPYYLGKSALYLFAGLNYVPYVAIILMVILQILPPLCLLFLLSIVVVQKNIHTFFRKQDKATTFVMAINNYVIIMGGTIAVLLISIVSLNI